MKEGLMQPPQGQAAQPPQAAQPAPAPGEVEIDLPVEETLDLENPQEASADEQKAYDEMMGQFFGLIHSGKMKKQVVEKLKQGEDNIGKAIGQLATSMFIVTEEKMENKGIAVTDAVRMEAGEDLVAELVQVAVLKGMIPDEDEPIGLAITSAIDVFASAYGKQMRDDGKMSTQQLEQIQGDMPMLAVQADAMFNSPQEGMPSQQTPIAQGVQQAGNQTAPEAGLLRGNQS